MPSLANKKLIALPIPEDAPVINAVLILLFCAKMRKVDLIECYFSKIPLITNPKPIICLEGCWGHFGYFRAMKKARLFSGFILLVLALVTIPYNAQSNFGCDLFCVTNVTLNTTEELWYVDVAFEGSDSDFINYPYVSQMVNSNGQVVAIGSMEYFGQFGGTTTTYHPALNINNPNFEGTVYFVFDQDTCALSYPCQTLGVVAHELNFAMIQSENELLWNTTKIFDRIELYNFSGQLVGERQNDYRINIQDLPFGLYIYQYQLGDHRKSGSAWIR